MATNPADYNWKAHLVDDSTLLSSEVGSVSKLPLAQVRQLVVHDKDDRIVGTMRVYPERGERLNMFVRHCVRIMGNLPTVSLLVFEIRRENVEGFVRLYLHPTAGVILSTEDLYF